MHGTPRGVRDPVPRPELGSSRDEGPRLQSSRYLRHDLPRARRSATHPPTCRPRHRLLDGQRPTGNQAPGRCVSDALSKASFYSFSRPVLCILDTLGCIIAGSVLPEPRQMLEAEVAVIGEFTTGNGCTVFGSHIRLPVTSAARANAFAGDQLELNDLLGGHASIGVVNAALSLAEMRNSTGTSPGMIC